MTTHEKRQFTREGTVRLRAITVAIAPVILVAGLLSHPFVADFTDKSAVTAALTADTAHWWLSHALTALGSGLLVLAFLAIRSHLREAGEDFWSLLALPFIVAGCTLFTFLPVMEFAPLAAHNAGGDALAVQIAIDEWLWFPQILFTSAALFAIGAIGFAVGIARSKILGPWMTRVVVVGFIVMAIRVVPSSLALYVNGVATLVALWPLAYGMWQHSAPQAVEKPRPAPGLGELPG